MPGPPPPPPPPSFGGGGGPPAPPPLALNLGGSSGGNDRANLLNAIADPGARKLKKVDPSQIKDRSKPIVGGSSNNSAASSNSFELPSVQSIVLCFIFQNVFH
jgi:hypothetical protein